MAIFFEEEPLQCHNCLSKEFTLAPRYAYYAGRKELINTSNKLECANCKTLFEIPKDTVIK